MQRRLKRHLATLLVGLSLAWGGTLVLPPTSGMVQIQAANPGSGTGGHG